MRTLRRIVSVIFILVIFYFLISKLISNWQKIPFGELRFDFLRLLLSFSCLLIYQVIFIAAWSRIVRELGEKIGDRDAFWIITTSQLAKYVPGGIWYTLGRVYLCKERKMNSGIIFLSVIIETCLLLLASTILFLVSLNFADIAISVNTLLLLFVVFGLLLILHPYLLNRLTNFALKLLKKAPVKLTIKYAGLLYLLVYFFFVWIPQIFGFWFLVNSIIPVPFSRIFSLAAAYTLSWMAGFIVPVAPGGLGVREGMMTLLLSPVLPEPLAIAISFISRVWITIFEIIVFLVGVIIRKSGKDAGPGKTDSA